MVDVARLSRSSARFMRSACAAVLLLVLATIASGRDHQSDERLSNDLRTGRYADALILVDELLRVNPDRDDLRNLRAVFGRGANMTVRRKAGIFKCEVSPKGVLLPLTVSGTRVDWLADTGANFSMISDAEATRLGLTILDAEGRVADLAGGTTATRVAVVPRMVIGRTVLEGATFMVFPAGEMPWRELPAGKQGILGLPPLVALDALSWTRSGECRTASAARSRRTSGAEVSTQIGGATERPVMVIPEVRLRLGGIETVLPEAHLFARPVGDDHFHGLLGMDLLSQAGAVRIDFSSMNLTLSP